jgi:hypothetical protein
VPSSVFSGVKYVHHDMVRWDLKYLASPFFVSCQISMRRLDATMYLSIFREKDIMKMGTSCCSHRRQRKTPPTTSLDNWLDFLPDLKDPMHDSAMSINAT